jgi:hypothetical protein
LQNVDPPEQFTVDPQLWERGPLREALEVFSDPEKNEQRRQRSRGERRGRGMRADKGGRVGWSLVYDGRVAVARRETHMLSVEISKLSK